MMMNDTQPLHRVALYFAPDPESAWWQAGSRWLGRCAATASACEPLAVPGVPPQLLCECTAEPRRYGFHATLKPPFRLAPGLGLGDVLQTVERLARDMPAFTLPPLRVTNLGDFLALRPEGDNAQADAIAARCVTALQPLAAPLSESELARRRNKPLTPEQDALLQRWGYPWVLQQFRFHFSLTGGLKACSAAQRAALAQAARQRFHSLTDCRFDRIAVFVEPRPGDDFVLAGQVELRP